MNDVQKLCVVEDMFFITGRGPVIIPGQSQAGQIRPGDWIELRSDGEECQLALVKSIEMVRFSGAERIVDANNPYGLLLAWIDRAAINRGDEVWSVSAPPAAEVASAVLPVPKKSGWQKIFGG